MIGKTRWHCERTGNDLTTTDWRAMTPTDRALLRKLFAWPQATRELAERFDVTDRTVRLWRQRMGYADGSRHTVATAAARRRELMWEQDGLRKEAGVVS